MSESAKAWLIVSVVIFVPATAVYLLIPDPLAVLDALISRTTTAVFLAISVILVLAGFVIPGEYQNLRSLRSVLLSFAALFFIMGLLVQLMMIAEQLAIGAKERWRQAEEMGCIPIVQEYEECGPVPGKPGFTECVKKTRKVCPEE